MSYSKLPSEKIEKLRTSMHHHLDTFFDHLENNREDQVQSALTEMENLVSEDLLDVVDAHLQSNNQESIPSVSKEQLELRSRIHCRDQSPSGPDKEREGAGAKQPEESFFAWACRKFQKMLEQVKQILQNLLPSIQWLTNLFKSVEGLLKVIKRLFQMAQSS
ncbi:interleukin-32 isoform X2 [Rhinolophus ferrumequinum]|uniref:interleukin-32 isoform X2 n=1 Tax=Rhinolophus ferrumequinum TaxID=59479 RepID=UPI00140F6114|nr:interleukin-32 isoform X2 [Rhinolophus ferrumequinum]